MGMNMPTIDELVTRIAALEKDRGTKELVAALLKRVDVLEYERRRGWDWSKLTPYLPAVRSLVWFASGLIGGGAVGGVALTPAPVVKEVIREVPADPFTNSIEVPIGKVEINKGVVKTK